MMIKKLDNLIRRIPDFDESVNPGRRDAMKALSAVTAGGFSIMSPPIINNSENVENLGMALGASFGVLFVVYTGKFLYSIIKSEIREYGDI